MNELDSIVNEDVAETSETTETAEPEVETTETTEAETTETDSKPDDAEMSSANEQTDETQDYNPQIAAFKKMALTEKEKRQDLERQLKEIQEQSDKPDLFEDPDAVLGSIKSEFNNQLSSVVTGFSEELARGKHDDYDSVMNEVYAMQQTDPDGLKQIMAQAEPGVKYAESIYQAAKGRKLLQQSGGVDGLLSQITQLQNQIKELEEGKAKLDVPPDTTTAIESGGDPQSADSDDSLEALLGR